MVDRFIGEVCILDTGDVVRVDQEQLETVLPKPGGKVRVVNAKYRGASAELLEIDERSFKATVRGGPACVAVREHRKRCVRCSKLSVHRSVWHFESTVILARYGSACSWLHSP